jgi:dolichol-phosphate mannosyltransferase
MKNQKIVVIGASGFVGSRVFELLLKSKYEVYGIGRSNMPWRIEDLYFNRYLSTQDQDVLEVLNSIRPNVIINFSASGAYSFQRDFENIVASNLILLEKIASWSVENGAFLIQAGTSSEYGLNSAGPKEHSIAIPNSLYSLTKLAGTHLLGHYFSLGLSCVVLRLYSVYGPREDTSRLMPAVMKGIIKGEWPNFTSTNISRDFIYIDNVVELLFVILKWYFEEPKQVFEIYNVGSGRKTTIQDLINVLMTDFSMPKPKAEKFPQRGWDTENWFSDIDKVTQAFGWRAQDDLKSGLSKMKEWYLTGTNLNYLGHEYSEYKG